jgi:hypothetical protein
VNDLNREILTENFPGFEEHVLQQTLSAARGVRRTRLVVRCGTTAVLALCTAALLWLPRSQNTDLASTIPANPLPENKSGVIILRSKEFVGVIRTQPVRADQTLLSSSRAFAVTRTADSHPGINRINDDQLLALFEGKAVALIGRGPNAKLIFPADTETK